MSKEYYKATVVLEVKKDYILVMDPGGEIHRLKKKDGVSVGDHIYYTQDDLYTRQSKVKKINFRPVMSIIAIAALVFLFVRVAPNLFTPSATAQAAISIGSDQGIQIEMNEDEEVIRIIDQLGLDIDSSEYQGQTLEEVMPYLVELVNESQSFDVLVAIASNEGAQNDELESDILSALEASEIQTNVVVVKGNMEEYNQSLENNVLLGDYQLANAGIELWSQEESRVLSAKEKQNYLANDAAYYQIENQKWIDQFESYQEYQDWIDNQLRFRSELVQTEEIADDDWYEDYYDDLDDDDYYEDDDDYEVEDDDWDDDDDYEEDDDDYDYEIEDDDWDDDDD